VEAGTRTNDGRPGPNYWQQEARYDLSARLFPEERRLEGSGTITYVNNSPDTLGVLGMELIQNLNKPGVQRNRTVEVTGGVTLERIAVDGQRLVPADSATSRRDPRYQTQNTNLYLRPAQPLMPGDSATIEVEWAFPIPKQGGGGRMGYDEDLFYLGYWYPIMKVYDDVVGWYTEPFRGSAEFYSDFAPYDLSITVPEGWIVQATGRLQNAEEVLTEEALQRRARAYRSDEPMQILGPDQVGTRSSPNGLHTWDFRAERVRDVAFSVTRNGHWDAARTPVGDRDGDGDVDSTRTNTFWRDSAPRWAQVTKYQQHAITFFSEYTGLEYPWPHMTAVEGGGIIGGGMEYPMMTIMGDYNTSSDSLLYAVTAHELAHMWVPMTLSTNERRYSWMDEGTTTFNENVARADYYPESDPVGYDRERYADFATSGREGAIMRWSNYHYSGAAFGIASYTKPATVLAALRGLLGEDTFQRAFRAFMDTWAYKHPYPDDLFNTFERVTGRDLDWFWYSWYYTTWTLDQAVAEVDTSADEAVTITVEDEGRIPMPVRLTITMADGSTMTREVPVDTWLSGRREASVTVPTGGPVQRVEIDADHDFPDVDRTNNVWTRDDAQTRRSSAN
jgi:hypothetical protein